jgi:transposase
VETIRKIQWIFGDSATGITQIKEWYNRFKDGCTLVESNACSGRSSTSQNDELLDQVWTLVVQDRRVTIRELAEEVGISTGLVHSILTDDLSMRRVSVKRGSCIMTIHQLIPRN